MKEEIKKCLKMIVVSCGILAIVFICIYHSSCHITPEGIVLLTDSYTCPKIEEYSFEGQTVNVSFSKPVKIEECFIVESSDDKKISSIENFLQCEDKIIVKALNEEFSDSVTYEISEKTKIGKKYELYSVVRDEKGSSLSFALPFLGENDHVPKIVISEINESYSKKDGVSEYVELYALTSGNLFGLELITASDGKSFELPSVEVNKGEYIVIHLRKDPENKQAVSELEKDLNLSKARGSVYGARDIWIDNTESSLNATAEIVLLNNKAKKKLLDCVLYCKKEYADSNDQWKSDSLIQAAKMCSESEIWNGEASPKGAVYSTERKSISFISRKNIGNITGDKPFNDSSCWAGTPKSKMSPGKPNRW